MLSRFAAVCVSLSLASPGAANMGVTAKIGVAGGVRGSVTALPPGDKPIGRVLSSGQPLYLGERITTAAGATMQVMLLDETIFTIGPNSAMTLDEFTYDPSNQSGKVLARISKGFFRFVTGQIGHKKPESVRLRFPTGVMAVRGTIIAGQVSDFNTTAVLLGPGPANSAPGERVGAFRMENAGAAVDVVKPGFGTTVNGNAPPTPPALIPPAQLNTILNATTMRPAPGPDKADKPEGPAGDRAANGPPPEGDGKPGQPGQPGKPGQEGDRSGPPQTARADKTGNAPGGGPAMGPRDASGTGPRDPYVAGKTPGAPGDPSGAPRPDGGANMPPPMPGGPAGGYAGGSAMDMRMPTGGMNTAMPWDAAGKGDAMSMDYLASMRYLNQMGDQTQQTTERAAYAIGDQATSGQTAVARTTWDQLRAISAGGGYYSGSGAFKLNQCAGGACTAAATGTLNFQLYIDFANKTIGGNGAGVNSSVVIDANDSTLGAAINHTIPVGQIYYGTFGGDVSITAATTKADATIQLGNVAGIADRAKVDAGYHDTTANTYGAGTAVGSLVCTTSATGCR